MIAATRALGARARLLAVTGVCTATVLTGLPAMSAFATTDIPYVEQGAPTPVGQYLTVSDPGPYDGRYVDFAVQGADASDILSLRQDSTPSSTVGEVTVVGSAVYLGNGSTAEQVGTVDQVSDGSGGRTLRVTFGSTFANASFETGDLSGWTAINDRIDLGVTPINGFVPADHSTYPGNVPNQDNNAPSQASYGVTVEQGNVSNGQYALRLSSTMQTLAGCDVVHGPAVYSSPFTASAGDSIYFDWRAYAGDDNFHVFGYIVDGSGNQIDVLDATGGQTAWTTKATQIPADGTYTFVFVAGTHDLSCGQAAGASLLIDNVQVYGHRVDAAAVQQVAQHLLYSSTTDRPAASRTITMNAVTQSGGTVPGQAVVTITPVDDAPTVTGTTTETRLSNTEGAQTYPTTTGQIAAADPDGDVLTYGITGATARTTTIDGQSYTHARTGTFGTLYVDATSGRYAFVPSATAVDDQLVPTTEDYTFTVEAVGVTVSRPYTVSVDVPPTAPGTPGPVTTTPGDRQATLSWTGPAWLGGSATTGYRVERSDDGGVSWTVLTESTGSAATSYTATGLTGGASTTFRVAAVNGTGTGAAGDPVTVTPYAPASAPVIGAVTGGAHKLTVTFTAPADVRGSAVTAYEYSLDGGTTWVRATGTTSPLVIRGLNNETTYPVRLRGVNAAGGGEASGSVVGTTTLQPIDAPGVTGGARPEVPAGQTWLVVDDVRQPVAVSTTDGAWTITGDGFSARLQATEADGTALEVDEAGRLIVHASGSVQVSGSGFAPGSSVDVWLFSTPYLLGQATVGADGTFSASFAMPEDLATGAHTVQMNGVGTDGAVRSLSTGLVVLADPVAAAPTTPLATTGSDSGVLGLAALVLVGLGVLALRVQRLARRRAPARA
ncbi:MAG TPA: fibronectin type III domain-containing protein [Cellulomonas sp.]